MKFLFAVVIFLSLPGVAMEKISFTSVDGVALSANLFRPSKDAGKMPAILILEGSGKSAQTEASSQSPFIQFAKGLSQAGFVVLQYNKRGSGENFQNGSFWKSTFTSDNEDAEAAFRYLKSQPGVDTKRIFLIGHSFGGPHSLMLATKQEIAGIVMLTSTIRPTDELLLEQNRILMELQEIPESEISPYIQTLSKDLAAIKAGSYQCALPNCSLIDEAQVYENSIQIAWMKEVLNLDFAALAEGSKNPILFLFGTSDCIIPDADFHLAKSIELMNPKLTVELVQKLDHFLVDNESKKESLLYAMKAQKENSFKPIHPTLVPRISEWMLRSGSR